MGQFERLLAYIKGMSRNTSERTPGISQQKYEHLF